MQPADRPDRKSTRLNSSHTVISYAVFCWKKKRGVVIGIAARSVRRGIADIAGTVGGGFSSIAVRCVAFGVVGRRFAAIAGSFFFNDTATTEIYTLSLHDALPI